MIEKAQNKLAKTLDTIIKLTVPYHFILNSTDEILAELNIVALSQNCHFAAFDLGSLLSN